MASAKNLKCIYRTSSFISGSLQHPAHPGLPMVAQLNIFTQLSLGVESRSSEGFSQPLMEYLTKLQSLIKSV